MTKSLDLLTTKSCLSPIAQNRYGPGLSRSVVSVLGGVHIKAGTHYRIESRAEPPIERPSLILSRVILSRNEISIESHASIFNVYLNNARDVLIVSCV